MATKSIGFPLPYGRKANTHLSNEPELQLTLFQAGKNGSNFSFYAFATVYHRRIVSLILLIARSAKPVTLMLQILSILMQMSDAGFHRKKIYRPYPRMI